MNTAIASYMKELRSAADKASRALCASPWALRDFVQRRVWMFDAGERDSLRALFAAHSDASVAYSIEQERRASAGHEADPARITKIGPPRAAGGMRALLFPAYMRRVRLNRASRSNRYANNPGLTMSRGVQHG